MMCIREKVHVNIVREPSVLKAMIETWQTRRGKCAYKTEKSYNLIIRY